MLPWRSSGDSSDKAFGIPPDPAAIAFLTDPFFASWPDGYTCVLSSITNEDVLAKLQRSASRVKLEPLWSGERKDCHHRLVLCQRVDRCLCFRCTSNRARFATGEWTFGNLPPRQPCKVPPSTPALMRLVEFARPFCEKNAARDVTNSAEMKKLRDEARVEQGFSKSTRAVAMKRLAAALPQDDAHMRSRRLDECSRLRLRLQQRRQVSMTTRARGCTVLRQLRHLVGCVILSVVHLFPSWSQRSK